MGIIGNTEVTKKEETTQKPFYPEPHIPGMLPVLKFHSPLMVTETLPPLQGNKVLVSENNYKQVKQHLNSVEQLWIGDDVGTEKAISLLRKIEKNTNVTSLSLYDQNDESLCRPIIDLIKANQNITILIKKEMQEELEQAIEEYNENSYQNLPDIMAKNIKMLTTKEAENALKNFTALVPNASSALEKYASESKSSVISKVGGI
jgi:hypothetical protein